MLEMFDKELEWNVILSVNQITSDLSNRVFLIKEDYITLIEALDDHLLT